MKSSALAIALAVALAFPPSCAADESGTAVGSNLPPRLRALLVQEMVAVLQASQSILAALVMGQDAVVAEKAQAIHDSFILEQEMTETDRQALVAPVPDAFVKKDRAFHELSARLAQAAREGDRAAQLARTLHQSSTATAHKHALSGFRSVGVLDIVPTMPAPSSVAKTSHTALLNRLATSTGSMFGLEHFGNMIAACTGCHSEHAADRFPEFSD